MGIDYGERRIGFALSDPSQLISSPLTTLANRGTDAFVRSVQELCIQHQIIAIVMGLPLHMDGRIGDKGIKIQELSGSIREKCHCPVILHDERWTTLSIHKTLIETGRSPSRSRQRIDEMAAALILQSFLDRLNYQRKNVEK